MTDADAAVSEELQEQDLGLFKGRRFVLVPILCFCFYAVGIEMYVQPEYTQSLLRRRLDVHLNQSDDFSACHANTSSHDYALYEEVQRRTAEWVIYFNIASLVPAVVVTLILGPMTDTLGRKFLLSLAIIGYTIKMTVWTVVVNYELSLVYVLVGQIINSFTGTAYVLFVVLYSFIADVTPPDGTRTMAIVLSELLSGAVLTVSCLASGYFIEATGFFYPMLLATSLAAAALFLTLVFFPETRRIPNREENVSCLKMSLKSIKIIGSVKRSVQFYVNTKDKVVHRQYVLILVGQVFFVTATYNRMALETLYELGSPFCWSPSMVGWFGTLRIGGSTFLGLGILKVMKLCLKDDTIAIIGGMTGIVSLVFEAFAKSDTDLFIVAGMTCISFLPVPMTRSITSQLTAPDEQGALFAGLGAMEMLCSLLGALMTNAVYSATLAIMNGFVFLVLAGLCIISLICLILLFILRRQHPTKTSYTQDATEKPLLS